MIAKLTKKMESLEKFQNLIENSTVGVYIIQHNRYIYVNPVMCQKSGYTEEELLNVPFSKFVHKDDLPNVIEKVNQRMSGEIRETRYETRVYKKNGDVMWLEVHGTVTEYDGAPAIIGTMIDITEKKKIYDDLAKSEANIRTIFDSTDIYYLLLDADLKIVSYNTYFRKFYSELTGFTVNVGEYFFDSVLAERQGPLFEHIDGVIKNARRIDYEVKYTNLKYPRYYFNQFVPVISNGIVTGVCLSGFEITERINLEMEREKVVTDLIERNRDLEQFSFIVSHNMRAPVANLLGLVQMFDYQPNKEDEAFIIKSIKECTVELDNVLKDLNEVLSVRKNIGLSKTTVDLELLTQNVIANLESVVDASDAIIKFDFSAVHLIKSIDTYLHSIFLNLISNAVKYSKADLKPEINIWSELRDNKLYLYFKDNGIGIDLKKNSSRLFKLYEKFNSEMESKGMGLFMIKTQVALLNGTIDVESEPGKGSTFIVSFPVLETV